jgi:hypothetical protein
MKAKLVIASALLIFSMSASAEEPATNHDELGMNQKLARVYDLYRKGDAVSLKPNEVMMGVGMAYATESTDTFGLQQSTRSLNTQVFASRGFGSGVEVSVSVPYIAQSQRAEIIGATLESKTITGFGDPTIRMMKMFQTKDIGTTGILSITLPQGGSKLSRKATHTALGANWSKVLRPAFVTGGLTWEHDWKSNANGLGYNAGLGFFLNHALSVGGEVAGVIALNPKAGAVRDITSIGAKVAYQTTPDFGVVVTANFGVGTDTPRSIIGVTTYWRF